MRMAPFSFTASAAMFFQVGFGFGSVEFKSGIICLYSSSTASIGNWPSLNGSPNLGPKRNTVHAVWCVAASTFGSWLGGIVPAFTAVIVLGSNPERARED